MTTISVIIPLYNKASEVERTLRSVLAQKTQPMEIIIVDDGSTDRSLEVVRGVESPLIKLFTQTNQGVSAARNRAIAEAHGEWVALLDADDRWCEDYLSEQISMIERYPDCGAYGSAFYVDNGAGLVEGDTPKCEGIVNFFEESMRRYVLIPSATILKRDLVMQLGGFPAGMRMGEDQYLWTRIARVANVAFTPELNVVYSRAASNRSAAIFRPEQSAYSLEDLYDPAASDMSNEYVARVALGKALVESIRGGTESARRALEFFSYNQFSHRIERKVRFFNSLPRFMRPAVSAAYNWLAWVIARKGI
jgi:glycosyltransferase involved in cell wall biosynthesis